MSRIDQQYWHWVPAHITAILLLSLKYQISLTPKGFSFKCGKLHTALLSSSSFLIITATRIFAKFLLGLESFPKPDSINQSMLISFIIHGASLVILILITGGLWLAITFYGNVAHSVLLKLVRLPIPTMSSVFMPIIEKFPITAGVVLVSIGSASCGGIAMICACSIYFILITKQYEDYLEDYIYGTAKLIAKKLFGKFADKFLKNRGRKTKTLADSENQGSEINAEADTVVNEEVVKESEDISKAGENEEEEKGFPNAEIEEEKGNKHEKQNEHELVEKIEGAASVEENEEHKEKQNTDNFDKEKEEKFIQNNEKEDNTKELQITSIVSEGIEQEQGTEDEELDRLLKEAIETQERQHKEQKQKEMLERKEYDSVHEGISSINFHMTMFLLLVVITLLNFPSTLSWAKNFKYSSNLSPDPSFIPSVIVIVSASILWQFSTPRNVYAYNFISCILYVCATICVLFCQDSVYRLNGVISSVYLLVTIHQICSPRKPEEDNEKEEDDMWKRIDQMKNLISSAISSNDT